MCYLKSVIVASAGATKLKKNKNKNIACTPLHMIAPTDSNETFAQTSADAAPAVEVVVELAARQPTCTRRLGDHVVEQFNAGIATASERPDGSYSIEIPYPPASIYDGCARPNGEFIPAAALANPKVITIIHAQFVQANPELASTHSFKIAAKSNSVEILVRPRPVAPAAPSEARATATIVDRLQVVFNTAVERGRPFPTEAELRATLAAAIPHREGQSRSAVYTVGSDENGVELFCRRLGLKFCLSKDQPKQEGLIRFRVFAENKEGYVEPTRPVKMGGGGGPKGGGSPGVV
jgi:hypothetical protein